MSRATHAASFLAGVIVAGTVGAFALPSEPRPPAGADRYRSLDVFAQALAYVGNEYVDPVDDRKLLFDATRGMVAGLDRHSQYFSARRYQHLRQDTEGEYGSVGLVLGPGSADEQHPDVQPYPYVDEVIPGSPAAAAGIAVDDRLVAVDGQATATGGKEVLEAGAWEHRLRGASGTRVTVGVLREGWKAPQTFSLVRAQVKVPSVEVQAVDDAVAPGLGYLAIRRFQEATAGDTAAALEQLQASHHLRGLILDLRNDPGGLLDQGIHTADLFLESGTIVTIRGRRGAVEEHVAHKPGTWSGFPIIVIVDGGTASAAEILSGALQDQKRARILGSRTYGKGSVQTYYDLDDGSGIKLTTARYYTPSGRSLEGVGITPDILVDDFAPEQVVAGGTPTGATGPASGSGAPAAIDATMSDDDDPQLAAAIRELVQTLGTTPGSK